MYPDPLQWLWDGVNAFQIKFNDLHTRAIRNFKRPFDAAQHDVHCGLQNPQTRMPCSCCKGALTFDEARLVKEKLTASGGRAMPSQKDLDFKAVPPSACCGIENCKELFGLGSDKEALSAVFEAGTYDHKRNLLFGRSGIISRTLDHWRELLDDAFRLIEHKRHLIQNREKKDSNNSTMFIFIHLKIMFSFRYWIHSFIRLICSCCLL
jgi:hypothetical protein